MDSINLTKGFSLRSGYKASIALLTAGVLTGCSTTSETFDCKAGKGVGCKSISEVNKMVDGGSLGRDQEGSPQTPLVSPVITTASVSPGSSGQDIALSDDMVVHRIREEHLRVWIAPFQDHQGNLHEGTVVHTVLKPGFWHVKGGE